MIFKNYDIDEAVSSFVEYFDQLNDDEKSEFLNAISSSFSIKYDVNLGFCLESTNNGIVDEYFMLPLKTTKVTFCWNEDAENLEWDVFGVNDK